MRFVSGFTQRLLCLGLGSRVWGFRVLEFGVLGLSGKVTANPFHLILKILHHAYFDRSSLMYEIFLEEH